MKRLGAVDRVENPPVGGVLTDNTELFAHDAVTRKAPFDLGPEQSLALAVCDGYRSLIRLDLDMDITGKIAEGDLA